MNEKQNIDENTEIPAYPQVHISKDGMQASVELTPDYAGSEDDIAKFLQNNDITHGIDRRMIANGLELVKIKDSSYRFQAASGTAPVDAVDGRIELKVDCSKKAGKIDETGAIDYHEIESIFSVTSGQILAVLVPPVESIPGTDVSGKTIPPVTKTGKQSKLSAGKNVKVEDNIFIATCDGMMIYEGTKIHVSEQLTIPGNVDFSVGNIRFAGDVTVRGSVDPGFVVSAEENIVIFGTVIDAVISAEKDIAIRQGVGGQGKTKIRAKGNVETGFVENSVVEAGGDIHIRSHVINSRIYAGGNINAIRGKGVIIGGNIVAGKGIDVKVVGSESTKTTALTLTGGLLLNKKLTDIEGQMDESEKTARKIGLLLGDKLIANPNLIKQVPVNKRVVVEKLVREYQLRIEFITSLQQQMSELEDEIRREKMGIIRVMEALYPMVSVSIARYNYTVTEKLGPTRFYADFKENKVKTG